MTARILQFGPRSHVPGDNVESGFKASVEADGSIRLVIRDAHGEQTWTLTPRQAVELAGFLNNDWMAGRR